MTVAVLARVLPNAAVGVEGNDADGDAELYPEEGTPHLVASRRRELAAGRHCARRALAQLGAPVVALPAGADRVPRWPEGVVGSITHTHGYVAAAVAWSRDLGGLGIDAESVSRMKLSLLASIAQPSEQRWLATLPSDLRVQALALLFSAKEAAFKCQYPRTGRMLDFQDASIDLQHEVELRTAGQLTLRFLEGPPAALSPFTVTYAFAGDLIVTAAHIRS